MSSSKPQKVAIIGAGLAGMTLAIALHKQGIPSTIYEVRNPDAHLTASGALMLCPNALHILSELDIYSRIEKEGYKFEKLEYKDEHNVLTDEYYLGGEQLFGFKALRVYRNILLREVLAVVQEKGIGIRFERKYSHIISEDDNGVEFAFENGTTERASLLIGADGIHSKVRRYIHPTVTPKFSGMMAITSVINISNLRFPSPDYQLTTPISIHIKHGAFVMAPQNPSGTEILVGTQRRVEEQTQEGWTRIRSNKAELKQMFQANMADWPDLVQSAMQNMDESKLAIWPYYVVPKLDSWCSVGKKVVILGDAAHAIPPTAGQGASQAFEDAYSLSLLLGNLGWDKKFDEGRGIDLSEALGFWEKYRMDRVEDILALTRKLDVKRLPTEDKVKEQEVVFRNVGDGEQQRWLFEPRIEEKMLAWVKQEKSL